MHCSKCGKQLEEDSKFCQYCGSPVIIVSEQPSQSNDLSGSDGWFGMVKKKYDISNRQVGLYVVWVFIHTLLWLFNLDGSSSANDYFWPFAKDRLDYYDFTEFFFYTATPIVFFVVRKLFKSK